MSVHKIVCKSNSRINIVKYTNNNNIGFVSLQFHNQNLLNIKEFNVVIHNNSITIPFKLLYYLSPDKEIISFGNIFNCEYFPTSTITLSQIYVELTTILPIEYTLLYKLSNHKPKQTYDLKQYIPFTMERELTLARPITISGFYILTSPDVSQITLISGSMKFNVYTSFQKVCDVIQWTDEHSQTLNEVLPLPKDILNIINDQCIIVNPTLSLIYVPILNMINSSFNIGKSGIKIVLDNVPADYVSEIYFVNNIKLITNSGLGFVSYK